MPMQTGLQAAKRSEFRIEILVRHALDGPAPYPLNRVAPDPTPLDADFKGRPQLIVSPTT